MPANTDKKGNKSKANKTTWRKGIPTPNPKGRPKTGESWGEIAKEIGEQYPEEVVKIFGENTVMGRAFASFPKRVQIKYSIFYRVVISLMNEPTPGLLKELLDRIEGKVQDKIALTGGEEGFKVIIEHVRNENTNTGITLKPANDNQSSEKI